jgi:hypothetical protein
MWARSFVRLGDLPDEKLFPELETGLALLVKNTACLADAASALSASGQLRPARILASHAEDEAGKFLLLMDAARCPRDRLRGHLKRAGHHLPRLLYAETAKLSPATFEELVGYLNGHRESHYLDGHVGVEWIFRNSLLYWREQALYVDYVEMEGGACQWEDPDRFEFLAGRPHMFAADLVSALAQAGLSRAPALEVIASAWRSFIPADATHITENRDMVHRTLSELESRDLLMGDADTWQRITHDWTFPLWAVDLDERRISKNDLLEQRERYMQAGGWEE